MPVSTEAARPRSRVVTGDYLRMLSGQGVSEFGSQLTVIALQLLAVRALSAGAITLGLISAARYVPFIFLGAIAGAWLDGTSKRRAMILSDVARGTVIVAVAVLYWLGDLTVPLVVLAALAGGVGRVYFDVANQAFVPQLVNKEDIVRANAALQNTVSAARVAGPSAAGVIVQVIGAPFALVLDGTSYFLNVFALLGMKVDTPITSGRQLSMWRRIRSGMEVIRGNEYLPWLMAASAVNNFALMIIQAIVVVYEVSVLHFSAWTVGVVASCDAVGLLAGSMSAPRLVKDGLRGQAMIVSYAVIAASTALLPLAGGTWPVALAFMASGYFFWGCALGVFNVANISFRHQITPPELMATLMGAWRTVLFGALPVGALVGGAAGAVAGLRGALWLGVAGNAVSALILVMSPVRRRLGRQGGLHEDS